MGDLYLVLSELILSTLDAGISIMVQQVRLMIFSLNMVDHVILVSAKVPLVIIGSFNWVGGVGPSGFGLLRVPVWGQGLTILH